MRRGNVRRAPARGRRGRLGSLMAVPGLALATLMTMTAVTISDPSTGSADTGDVAYFCSSTSGPSGTVYANVTGSIPAGLSKGTVFNLTNFQILVNIPVPLLQAVVDAGGTTIGGTVQSFVDAKGATPSSKLVNTGSWGPFTLSNPVTSDRVLPPRFTGHRGALYGQGLGRHADRTREHVGQYRRHNIDVHA